MQLLLPDVFEQGLAVAENDGHEDELVLVDESEIGELLHDRPAAQNHEVALVLQFDDFVPVDRTQQPDILPLRPFFDALERFRKGSMWSQAVRPGRAPRALQRRPGPEVEPLLACSS